MSSLQAQDAGWVADYQKKQDAQLRRFGEAHTRGEERLRQRLLAAETEARMRALIKKDPHGRIEARRMAVLFTIAVPLVAALIGLAAIIDAQEDSEIRTRFQSYFQQSQ